MTTAPPNPRRFIQFSLRAILLLAFAFLLSFFFMPFCIIPIEAGVRTRISRLAGEAHMRAITAHHLPAANIHSLIEWIDSDGNEEWAKDRNESYLGIDSGLDSWGHEIIVEVVDSGVLVLRSVGKNGVDERGKATTSR